MLRMSESIFEFAVQDILHKILLFSVQLFTYNVILRNVILFSFSLCLHGLLLIWQGRFEILCLSGSYLVLDDGGTHPKRRALHSFVWSRPQGYRRQCRWSPDGSWNSSGDFCFFLCQINHLNFCVNFILS